MDTLKTVGQIDEDSDDGIMADDFDEPDEADSGNKNFLQISAFCLLKNEFIGFSSDDEPEKIKLETNIEQDTEKFVLPSGQEIEKESSAPPDMTLVKNRIEENLSALKNFKVKREEGRTRAEYMELLKKDLKYYYGQVFKTRVTCFRIK